MYFFKPLAPWHMSQIPEVARPRLCEDTKGLVAEDVEGNVVAAALFDSWTENACMAHIFIGRPRVIKQGFLHEGFGYVFNTCRKGVIIGATPAQNAAALHFAKRVGFKEVARLKDGCSVGEDMVITRLEKSGLRLGRGVNCGK